LTWSELTNSAPVSLSPRRRLRSPQAPALRPFCPGRPRRSTSNGFRPAIRTGSGVPSELTVHRDASAFDGTQDSRIRAWTCSWPGMAGRKHVGVSEPSLRRSTLNVPIPMASSSLLRKPHTTLAHFVGFAKALSCWNGFRRCRSYDRQVANARSIVELESGHFPTALRSIKNPPA